MDSKHELSISEHPNMPTTLKEVGECSKLEFTIFEMRWEKGTARLSFNNFMMRYMYSIS